MANRKVSNAGGRVKPPFVAPKETVELKPLGVPSAVDAKPVEFPARAKRGPGVKAAAEKSDAVQALTALAKAEPAASSPLRAAPEPLRADVSAPSSTTDEPEASLVPEFSQTPELPQSKDTTMDTQTTDFTARDTATGFKDVFADVKTKAKAAFEKGASSLGDYAEFAKGNVEAAVESGKIFAAGLQELGGTYAAESKTAFEALTADAKELAAQKTPTDFFKLQGEIARKNFESAVAFGTKNSEAWIKLAGDAFAPLSGRVNLAVEKIKTTA